MSKGYKENKGSARITRSKSSSQIANNTCRGYPSMEGDSESELELPEPTIKDVYQSINKLHNKTDRLSNKFDNLNDQINHSVDGIEPRLSTLRDEYDDSAGRIHKLEVANHKLMQEMTIMKGLLQKQDEELKVLRSKVDDQAARSMQQNVIFHNIEVEADTKDFKPVVKDFLSDKMDITADLKDIYVAHTLGEAAVVAKVHYDLKEKIFKKVKKLENLKNKETKKSIFVTGQQPESMQEGRRAAKAKAREYEAQNEGLPDHEKAKVVVRKDKLYVNNNLIKNPLPAPQPRDLFPDDPDEQRKIDNIKIVETEHQGENGSIFWGIGAKIRTINDARRAYVKVRQRYPNVTHVMAGYGIKEREEVKYGNQDDGEYGGSYKILEHLKESELCGLIVFVARKYGGINIGKKRFTHIKKCAELAVEKMGRL